MLGEGEELVRVHALLEDLLQDRNYGGDLLHLAHPRRNQQESLLRQVLLPVVELAGRNLHLRQAVSLRPSGNNRPFKTLFRDLDPLDPYDLNLCSRIRISNYLYGSRSGSGYGSVSRFFPQLAKIF